MSLKPVQPSSSGRSCTAKRTATAANPVISNKAADTMGTARRVQAGQFYAVALDDERNRRGDVKSEALGLEIFVDFDSAIHQAD